MLGWFAASTQECCQAPMVGSIPTLHTLGIITPFKHGFPQLPPLNTDFPSYNSLSKQRKHFAFAVWSIMNGTDPAAVLCNNGIIVIVFSIAKTHLLTTWSTPPYSPSILQWLECTQSPLYKRRLTKTLTMLHERRVYWSWLRVKPARFGRSNFGWPLMLHMDIRGSVFYCYWGRDNAWIEGVGIIDDDDLTHLGTGLTHYEL